MRARMLLAALAAFLVAVTVAASAAARPAASGQAAAAPTDVRAAFLTNWSRYARGYTVKQIPADKLNVLDYAFGAPTAAGTCGLTDPWSDYEAPTGADQSVDGVADDSTNPNQHLYGNFNQLLKLKAAHAIAQIAIVPVLASRMQILLAHERLTHDVWAGNVTAERPAFFATTI